MKVSRLIVRYDRLPTEMKLGDADMRKLFRRRRKVPRDTGRCDAAVIIGLNPRHWDRANPIDLLVGAAYRCPNKRVPGIEFCPWHQEGRQTASGSRALTPEVAASQD